MAILVKSEAESIELLSMPHTSQKLVGKECTETCEISMLPPATSLSEIWLERWLGQPWVWTATCSERRLSVT